MRTPRAPAFQFYPDDWLRDISLRRCSLAARGLWADMIMLMHQGDPYGHLRSHEADIRPEELARISGVTAVSARSLLSELEDRGVFSRTEIGTIFSRRMVRDEAVRAARAAGGKKSVEHPNTHKPKDVEVVKGYPYPPPSHPPPSSSSSSSSSGKAASVGTGGVAPVVSPPLTEFPLTVQAVREFYEVPDMPFIHRLVQAVQSADVEPDDAQLAAALRATHRKGQRSKALWLTTVPELLKNGGSDLYRALLAEGRS